MADAVLPRILKHYEGADFVTQLKVRFLFHLNIACVVVNAIIFVTTLYFQLTQAGGGVNVWVMGALGACILFFGGCLALLIKGYFEVSAHALLITGLTTAWVVMVTDHSGLVARLDTIVIILGLLAMLPLISRQARPILIYTSVNIIILTVFVFSYQNEMGLTGTAIYEYLIDTIIALVFIGIVSYNVLRINTLAIDKAEADIRERTLAEQAFSHQTSILAAQSEASFDGILVVDENGNMTSWNNRFREIWGIPEEVLHSKSDAEAIKFVLGKLVDPDGFVSKVNDLYKNKSEICHDEVHLLDGTTFDRYSAPAWSTNGEYLGRVWYFRDISERRKAEEEREKLQGQLMHSQKMESIGRLAGGVAHDYNNMLSVIIGHAGLALQTATPGHPCHAHLLEIQKAAQHSAVLTSQLLAFARKQTISPKPIDLNKAVAGLLKMLTRLIGENIELAWFPSEQPATVNIDPSQLDQILANLCVNARDAIKDIGKITIQTRNISFDETYCANHAEAAVGNFVGLSISDTGCGMDKAIMARLFEPFFTTKSFGKGTGLGLATVYGIIKQNNGFINVYSEPGRGTTFNIYLPVYIGGACKIEFPHPDTELRQGTETILLVEDEPSILSINTQILSTLGYRVLAAKAPSEALHLAQESPDRIHLLVTDVVMPEMNGPDLAKQLTAIHSGMKCLFTSGYSANIIAHHGVLDEGVNFIQKPFSIQELGNKIRSVLDGS